MCLRWPIVLGVRRRDELFVEYTASALDAGWSVDAAATRAVKRVRTNGASLSDAAALRVAKVKLANPAVREALAEWIVAETGLTAADAMRIRAGLVLGRRQVLVTDKSGAQREVTETVGEMTQLRALEGYEKLTYIPQTHKVEVDQRTSLSAIVIGDMAGGVPEMAALPVGDPSILKPVLDATYDEEEEDDEDDA